MVKTKRRLLVCKRCGYQWFPNVRKPLSCPNPECRSPFWDKERRRKR